MENIRLATQFDANHLGRLIGEAFAQDPVSLWAQGSAAVIRRTFEAFTSDVYIPRGHCVMVDGVAGALWLKPHGEKQMSLYSTLKLGLFMMTHVPPLYAVRSLRLDAELRRRRPRQPHMYLFALGVEPAARKRGLATQTLQHTLAQCDAQGLPAFLENTSPANHGLYTKLGFVPVETYAPVKGCPVVTSMWREPRLAGIMGEALEIAGRKEAKP